jgi:2-dehydro-3-deoxyphosphogluconate aldolase/(4S)-4-hydroxy-2-oxoglutarate aldolase
MTIADELRTGPVAEAIRRHRLVAILRRVEPRAALLDLVTGLADAGVRVLEITFDAPSAETDLVAVRERLAARTDGPFVVGAGTLRRPSQLEAAVRADAAFGVAPALDAGLLAAALDAGLPFLPGALTPTEIVAAHEAGATFVKLFPASAVGPAFVRELRGPLPDVELVPTGGIDAANAGAFLTAGASAVGVGGALVRGSPEARRTIVGAVTAAGGAR